VPHNRAAFAQYHFVRFDTVGVLMQQPMWSRLDSDWMSVAAMASHGNSMATWPVFNDHPFTQPFRPACYLHSAMGDR
jgi:hypothetical protein